MWEYILNYKDEIFRVISIFSITMAIVYILGRMLNILKEDISKNIIALISILSLNTFYALFIANLSKIGIVLLIWNIGLYSAWCILVYVLVGFKLYSRADSFLDLKIGKDKPNKKGRL